MTILGIDNSIKNLLINKDKNHCSCKEKLSDEMIDAIRNYECLSIGFSRGEWTDLSFLHSLSPSLERLRAQSENMDWESINRLSNLKQLRIDGVIKGALEFQKLTSLKSLEYHWDKKNADSLLMHQGIEHLILYGAKIEDFTVFENMTSLKRLEIIRGNFNTLTGIEKIKNLKSLQFDYVNKLEDLSALNKLDKLIHLGFGSCNKVKFDADYSGLTSLRELSMLKQKHVDTLAFVASLPKLEILKVFEMTIKDGDLQFLAKMPKLKSLRMDMKKHYNFNLKEFKDLLIEKNGDFEIDIFATLGLERF